MRQQEHKFRSLAKPMLQNRRFAVDFPVGH